GEGRRDPSGDYTKGAGLEAQQIGKVEQYLSAQGSSRAEVCNQLAALVGNSVDGREGVDELEQIDGYLRGLGYGEDRVIFDPTVVRGLSYYTGPVFEGVLTGESASEGEAAKQFGSIFGGGRYDNLVERFTGQKVPATGASVGVDRLLAALEFSGKLESRRATADVLVTTMDPGHMDDYLRLAQELRRAGVNTEVYLGSAGIGAQLKYADKCGIPLAVIAGSEEFSKGEFQVKNLRLGKQLAEDISGREEWLKDRPAQQSVKQDKIVASIKELLSSIS
ncbi:ATP phosphoribosyltransferase regulatory subunit, partial [bacterium]|nr:ATP phosphoribosyltransferase regulatory subunit [bacterium]